MPWEKIASILGMSSGEAARSKYRRERIDQIAGNDDGVLDKQVLEEDTAAAIFLDKKRVTIPEWRDLLNTAIGIQKMEEDAEDTQKYSEIRIETNGPVAIMYTGDWHLGSRMAYEAWSEDIRFVLETPEIFMVDLGDSIQNMRTFKDLSGVLGQVLSPKQQAWMIRGIIDDLTSHGKLLAKVTGNHDEEFDERIYGQSVQAYLLEKMQAPRFKNRGLVKLKIGSQEYTNVLFHKSRFRSFMRATHGSYREYGQFFPADVVAGAHDHEPGIESIWHYGFARENGFSFGGQSILIRVGSPQMSSYGWKYFHGEQYLSPTVVYFPDHHKKLSFTDPHDAVSYIRSLKEKKNG
jgi:hypothetical protein